MSQNTQREQPVNGKSKQALEPAPEVLPMAKRRQFSREYKLRILAEAAQCQHGELGALLRLAWLPIQTIYRDERSHSKPIHHTTHIFRVFWQLRR